ncbi:DUF1269 domain-containing protein [Amycolatopsis decaplanina]|uniref:Membrane protein of uknown function UCP014873 n=1 Tax=Amycolatopsis decaplanina DSM 44594 TaxID=1284240 RepID=M2YHS5_9PSEU|nr:DUF1269 domain-containing protein [Amycolatopsis decaplanina]EME54232.1 hypothetical protein H074_29833 [Amycolatopsis decaplanina DSM 44594]
MDTLTIWMFNSADGADHAAETVKSLAKRQLISVHDAATVSWPKGASKPKLRQQRNLAGHGALTGAFWGMLFGLIFLVPLLGAAVGATAGTLGGLASDYGIDDDLIRQIRGEITEGTSALFLLSSGAVIDKVRDAFAGQERPELIFTNLTPEQEKALRETFTTEKEFQTAEEPGTGSK